MKKIDEAERLEQMTQYERPFWERGIAVAGMDEVGRGPLAGPVVAACVILPPGLMIEGVNDSKKLTKKRMEKLYPLITGGAAAFGTGWVFQKEIDEINILQATKKRLPKPTGMLWRIARAITCAATFLLMPLKTLIFPPCSTALSTAMLCVIPLRRQA